MLSLVELLAVARDPRNGGNRSLRGEVTLSRNAEKSTVFAGSENRAEDHDGPLGASCQRQCVDNHRYFAGVLYFGSRFGDISRAGLF